MAVDSKYAHLSGIVSIVCIDYYLYLNNFAFFNVTVDVQTVGFYLKQNTRTSTCRHFYNTYLL